MAAKSKPGDGASRPAKAPKEKAPKEYPPLPPSLMGLLNKKQVCLALGAISIRSLDEMISAGEFPRADKRVGRRPRWSVALVNLWVHDLAAGPDLANVVAAWPSLDEATRAAVLSLVRGD
jgi:hypothetical protein